MSNTSFKDIYYKLVKAELERLFQLAILEQDDRQTVNEYISQNELGLAFEIISGASADAKNLDEFQAQKDILSGVLE